jgi:hypothetical protein
MSEKMKLLITEIKESTWNDKTYYNCKTASGLELTTTDAEVKKYLNVEHEFDINSKPDKNNVTRHYINFPKQGGGGSGYPPKKSYMPTFKDSKDAAVLSAKTMILSYVKDLAIKNAEISGIPVTMETVKTAFNSLLPVLDIDKLQESQKSASTESTGADTRHTLAPIPHELSAAKQAIINKHVKNMNFRAKDLIDYAGACGIEIGYDAEHDSAIIGKLTETDGEKLINALQDANR